MLRSALTSICLVSALTLSLSAQAGTRQELDECSATVQGVGGKGRTRVCPQPIVTKPQPPTNTEKPQTSTNTDKKN
jgi:hypothetical protein